MQKKGWFTGINGTSSREMKNEVAPAKLQKISTRFLLRLNFCLTLLSKFKREVALVDSVF